ncbi:unnamed protein product, partial [Sphacelaria rigidula]
VKKKPLDPNETEGEPSVTFSSAWSGVSESSPPRGGRSDIPRSPASHLKVALKRDEALEKEQAAEAAAKAAAAGTADAGVAAAEFAAAEPTPREEREDPADPAGGFAGGDDAGNGDNQTRGSENDSTRGTNDVDTSSLFSSNYFPPDEVASSPSIATTDPVTPYSASLGRRVRGENGESAGTPDSAAFPRAPCVPAVAATPGPKAAVDIPSRTSSWEDQPPRKFDESAVIAHLGRSFSSETSSGSDKEIPTSASIAPFSTVGGEKETGGGHSDGGDGGDDMS